MQVQAQRTTGSVRVMSATEALDAYLERQRSSKRASSSARAVGKPQDTLRAAAKSPPRLTKHSESRSRLGNMAKGPLLKAGAPGADDRGREGAIRAVWPPNPLDEKDERPLLAKAHPATARTAQRKTSEKATGDQVTEAMIIALYTCHEPNVPCICVYIWMEVAI